MADAVDELFTALPQEFVARRDELAKRLRKEGQRAEAAEVKKLRRPTAAVWALNQLAREHPDDVAELLDAGADLPAAQEALLGGDQQRFRDAVTRHRELVSKLARLGARLVEEREASATDQRQDIATELQAASTIPEAAEPFRQGRLPDSAATLGEPVTGLPGGGLAMAPAPARTRDRVSGDRTRRSAPARDTGDQKPAARKGRGAKTDRADDSPDGDDAVERRRAEEERAEAERAEQERLEAERAEADRRVAQARQAVDDARAEHDEASREVADLEQLLARAQRRRDDADQRLTAAEDDLADAEAARRRLD